MSLVRDVVSGVRWSSVARFAEYAITLSSTVVLARLLTPDAFGLLGMAVLATGCLATVTDLGLAAALIQHRRPSHGLVSAAFWVAGGVGVLLTAVVYGSAPLVAAFFREPAAAPVLRALSPMLALSAIGAVPMALLRRDFRFGRIAAVQLGSALLAAAVAIGMAWGGLGVWSLVGQQVTRVGAESAGVLAATGFRPERRVRISRLREVLSYGVNLSGFNIVGFAVQNVDNLLIGRFLGSTALGYYDIAWRLIQFPVTALSDVFGRVVFPAFSAMRGDVARVGRAYLRVCSALALVSFPVAVGLMVLADPLVELFLGDAWLQVAPLLMLLAPVGAMQSVGSTTGNLYMARARTGWLFLWGISAATVNTIFMAFGLAWGLTGVAVARLVANMILSPVNFHIALGLVGRRLSDIARALEPVATAATIMLIAMIVARAALPQTAPPGALMAIEIPFGTAVYVWVLLRYRADVLNDLAAALAAAGVGWAEAWVRRARLAKQ